MEQSSFYNPTLGKMEVNQVVNNIADFIRQEPANYYRLIIGSDSHERSGPSGQQKRLNLVSAIVIHRRGKGGRYFWQKQNAKRCYTLKEKMYLETLTSLQLAEYFVPKLNRNLNGQKNYELEIHIDVGRSGDTRDMIKELVGMVNGNGYTARTKPDSYGASKVADKHT